MLTSFPLYKNIFCHAQYQEHITSSQQTYINHYKGKIKTEEDAKVAIDSMLESLDDPYSRFLTREEFTEQNNYALRITNYALILNTNKTIDKKSSHNPYMQDYARFFV